MTSNSLLMLIPVAAIFAGTAHGMEPTREAIRLDVNLSVGTSMAMLGFRVPQETAVSTADQSTSTPRFGSVGSTRFSYQTALAVQGGDNFLFLGGFGFEHFIADDLSLVTQLNGAYADQDGPEASGGNVVLLLRWHFHTADTWSAFFEAGAGAVWFTEDVPEHGSQFNLTPQAAAGLTFDIGGDNRAYVAIGWHHISNGQIFDENPGRDSAAVHFGLSIPF